MQHVGAQVGHAQKLATRRKKSLMRIGLFLACGMYACAFVSYVLHRLAQTAIAVAGKYAHAATTIICYGHMMRCAAHKTGTSAQCALCVAFFELRVGTIKAKCSNCTFASLAYGIYELLFFVDG